MMNYIVSLVGAFAPMWDYTLTALMCLMFVATVPAIIREVVRF